MGPIHDFVNLEEFEIHYLIPPLDTLLLLIASLYPVGFCANVAALVRGPVGFGQSQSLGGGLFGFLVGYAILLVVFALIRPQQLLAFDLPTPISLLLLAPLVGIVCILLEYFIQILLLFFRTRKFVRRAAVHSSYSAYSRIGIKDILCIVALVVGEELILRQMLYELLANDLGITHWNVVCLCAVVFAMNHLAFGIESVISKLPSGILYVWFFSVSGLSIDVVIVAHVTQNLVLLVLSRTRH